MRKCPGCCRAAGTKYVCHKRPQYVPAAQTHPILQHSFSPSFSEHTSQVSKKVYSAIFNLLSTRRYYITCQSFFYTLICQNCKFSCGLSCPALPCGLLHSLSRRFPPLQLCTQLFQRFFLNARYIAPRLLQAARRQPAPPPASLAIMAGSPPFRQAPKMRGPDQLLPSGPPPSAAHGRFPPF